MGAFGGLVRVAISRRGFISYSIFILEALIGAFVALVIGMLLSNYSTFSIETIYAVCGLSGVIARDLIPLFIKKANEKIEEKVEGK